jgi:DNA-binding MarR family transcriptional regulator
VIQEIGVNSIDAFDIANCTCANLRKANRAVTQVFDDALRAHGLRATQFTLLGTISRAGELPLTQLADLLVMDRTTLTRNLQPLIRRGLITDEIGDDQRVRRIKLTAAGEAQFNSAMESWRKVQQRMVDALGRETWQSFVHGLKLVVGTLQ